MNNTEIPNTVSELIQQNQEPLSPETIWEEFRKMSVTDQETFIWNAVRSMKDFHFYVGRQMMEDDPKTKEDVGVWIQDGTKWNEILRILGGMDIS